jgi:hypothetical protein
MSEKGHCVVEADAKAEPFTIEKVAAEEGSVLLDIEYKVSDKDGKVVHQHNEYGDSFLYNFLLILYCAMGRMFAPDTGSVLTVTDTAAATPTADEDDCPCTLISAETLMDCNALSTDDSHGILVGTGNTAVDIEDYALATKVAEGAGATQMNYGNHSIVNSASDAGNTYSYAGISRTIVNNSGGAIVIAEVGLACQMEWANANSNILLLREVLGSTVSVGDGLTLTVTVRIKCYV